MEDSFHKIVTCYFAAVTKQPIDFAQQVIQPKTVVVSPLLFRGFTCHEKCGACCPRYSLVYLPSEIRPSDARPAWVDVNHSAYCIYQVTQDSKQHYCEKLDQLMGTCKIQAEKPFHCDFELIRPLISTDRVKWIQKLPGRHWAMLRIPGEGRGARCVITAPTEQSRYEVIRKLKRLKEWTDYFELDTWLPEMIAWAIQGPHNKSLVLIPDGKVQTMVHIGET